MFNDVMASFHDVIPSCKYDVNNQVEFSHQRNHKNENEISSRAHLQAELKAVRFLTSCSNFNDVMTSRHDVMTSCKHKNDNTFRLGELENYRNKKRIISLAFLQAEME